MKKIIQVSALFLLSLSVLSGCKSTDQVLFRSQSAALTHRLPALEVAVDNGQLAATEGAYPGDPLKLFQQEVKQNLVDEADSARFGYLKLQVTSATTKRGGRGLQAFQMATLMVPSLFGLPIEYCRTAVQAEVQVIDSHGELVGTYIGEGTSNVRVAMYHGYSQTQAARLADVEALRQALNQIRPQLEGISDSLRTVLLTSGPIEEVIVGQANQ